MKTRTLVGSVLAAAVACLGLSTPTFATPTAITQTFNLNQVFTGNIPDGPAPWLSATFTYDTGSTTGTLVLTSGLSSADFIKGATGVTGWGFYLSGNSLADWNCSAGVCADTVLATTLNSGPVKGPGKNGWGFNFGFGWTAKNVFDGTDTATYDLTFANALTSTSPFMANGGGWYSYAHVQGIGPNGSCSGFIVNGTGTLGDQGGLCNGGTHEVPEPNALGVFGLGVLLIGGFLGWRRRHYS